MAFGWQKEVKYWLWLAQQLTDCCHGEVTAEGQLTLSWQGVENVALSDFLGVIISLGWESLSEILALVWQMMTVGFKITKNIQTRTNMWKPLTDQYGWNRASLAVRAYYLPLAVLVSHWDTFAVTLMWHLKDIASCCLYCPCFKCHCCVRCSVVIWTVCKSVPHLDSKMIIFVLCGTLTRTLLYVLAKCLRAGVSVSVWTPLWSFICVSI